MFGLVMSWRSIFATCLIWLLVEEVFLDAEQIIGKYIHYNNIFD